MKLREIITQLMESISNGVEESKYQEIKEQIIKLVPYAEYEEEVVMFDLKTILKIINEGFYYYTGGWVYYHSGDELKIDMVDQSFKYIELNDYDDDAHLWYEETFPFEDFGKRYFLTKEECENYAKEHIGQRYPKWDAR
jgi:hypothetical protein